MFARLPTVRQRTPVQSRYYAHGGLTPAAPGYPRDDRVRMCADCPRRRDSRTTAGSRPPLLVTRPTTVSEYVRNRAGHAILNRTAESHPPLLVRVRLCIAKVAIPPAGDRVKPRAEGRKPPVVTRARLQRRSSARWWQSREQLRECRWMNDSVNHGGLTPAAPGYPSDDCVRICT